MDKDFEILISTYIENKIGIAEHFFTKELLEHLKTNLLELSRDKLLKAAGTGHNDGLNHNKAMRSDAIYWLDRKHNNIYENAFFDRMDAFVTYLNQSCYAGISSYEFHYSLYAAGTFYKTHLDQFKDNSKRKYSMINYLNADWKLADGGQLCIHEGDTVQLINPTQGKTVFFKSNELLHEVLLSHEKRMSITGWLKIS